MKKILVKLSLFILGLSLVLCPIFVFAYSTHRQTHIYSKTYYAALVDKIANLKSLENQKKIVLIGGSNVAFGFNSELLQQEFPEYKVVNFGLYAMLGTKIMMDLAIDYINAGDMVFIIPEINEQSTSLYFNANATLKAIEDNFGLFWKLDYENKKSVIREYSHFIYERNGVGEIIQPSGVYQRRNFNIFGDIYYDEKDEKGISFRSVNRMTVHYDPTMPVSYSHSIDGEFFKYLNNYNSAINKKNAKLYYAFSPVNQLSQNNSDEQIIDYYWRIRNNLKFNVIGNPKEYIIDPHYFYDSNFHLNDSGAIYRTYLFAQDIYRDILCVSTSPHFDVPDLPDYPDSGDVGEDSVTAPYFEYEGYGDYLLISGVNNDHIHDEDLVLPEVANHKKVVGIAKDAFSKCDVIQKISIGTNIGILMDGCFGNCRTLIGVYVETHNPDDIIVSYTGSLVDGVSPEFKIYIHDDCFNSFATNYYWANYLSYFVRY